MSTNPVVDLERRGATAIVSLNEPEKRNALTLRMRTELLERLLEARADPALRAIVLAAKGSAFCAGGDLKTLSVETAASMLERQFNVQSLIRTVMTGYTPVIAAVEGMAMGAGFSLALASDIVVAAEGARFGAVFGKVGLAPDLGMTWCLPRRVGIGRARLLTLTGRVIDASTAAAWGVADELVPAGDALGKALSIADEIAATAPLPARIVRRALAQPFASLDQALDFEALAQTALIGTEDFTEGFAAFSEKRSPAFQGK